jgi:alkyl sulfatase BDS1-like metallo-beta-lactamase superfamily hydrolase
VLDHLVFAEPSNGDARELLARCYDQLGYRAESGPWRDVYLSGAYELRHGEPTGATRISGAAQLLRYTPMDRFLDSMAARLDGPKADGVNLRVNFVFTDIGESYRLWIENAVLHHRRGEPDPKADVTVRMTKAMLLRLALGQAGLRDFAFSKEIDVDGNRLDLVKFFSLLDAPDPNFAIVRP